jgi:hypothetical protein
MGCIFAREVIDAAIAFGFPEHGDNLRRINLAGFDQRPGLPQIARSAA